MQVVIDIPESILNTIQADEMISREQLAVLQMHILNGTPLNSLIDQYQHEIESLDQDIQDEPRGTATAIKRAQMGMLYRVVSDLKGDE